MLGMIHPRLRTAFLLQEFLQQEGKTVEVRVGSAVSAEAITAIRDDREATEYLTLAYVPAGAAHTAGDGVVGGVAIADHDQDSGSGGGPGASGIRWRRKWRGCRRIVAWRKRRLCRLPGRGGRFRRCSAKWGGCAK